MGGVGTEWVVHSGVGSVEWEVEELLYTLFRVAMYESKKLQLQVHRSLEGLMDASQTLKWISSSYRLFGTLHETYCLSYDFTWSEKFTLEKQTI